MIKSARDNYVSNDISVVDLAKELIEIIKNSNEKAFQKWIFILKYFTENIRKRTQTMREI